MAEARKLIAGAAYGPAELKVITDSFEAAWQDIADDYTSPLAIQAARLKLANVVLGRRHPWTERGFVPKACEYCS